MILKELENGTIFCHAKSKSKNPKKFVVYGNPAFNGRHGSSTRNCKTMDGILVSKSCRLEVTVTGTSIHVEKIKSMFNKK